MRSGVVFLDKPVGWTSRQAVNFVIQALADRPRRLKAGHTGTLDPLASGMLPVLLGEATRFSEYGLEAEKRYRVTLDLSYQTDTLDREGEVTQRYPQPENLDFPAIHAAIDRFRGPIMQVPPAYSAIRVQGRRAHAMARAGEAPELKARPVEVHALAIREYDWPLLELDVECSKGTYVRALARDIGDALGLGGCVVALRRLSTGGWSEDVMVSPEQLEEQGWACVVPLAQWLHHLPRCRLEAEFARRFVQGQRLPLGHGEPGEVAVFCGDTLLGTGRIRPGGEGMVLHPHKVLPSARESWA